MSQLGQNLIAIPNNCTTDFEYETQFLANSIGILTH